MRTDNTKENRIEWVDFAKGIGIILVVFGHSITSDILQIYLHAFHMPYFFIISGFLASNSTKDSILQYIQKKIKSLLTPYFVFGISTYILWLIIYSKDISRGTITDWYSPLLHLLWINSTGLKISGEFWFITALLFASILFRLLLKMTKSNLLLPISVFPIVLVGLYFRRMLDLQLPWSILSGCVGVGFMYVGFSLRYSCREQVKHLLKLKWFEMVMMLIVSGVLIWMNGEVNMRRSLYSNVVLFYINAIIVSLVILNLCIKTVGIINESALCKFIKKIGKDSITYVCLDSVAIKTVSSFFRGLIPTQSIDFIIEVLTAIISIVILYFINDLIYRCKLKFILGK